VFQILRWLLNNIKDWVEKEFKLCLERLNIKYLYGLLIHQTESLDGEKGKIIIDSLNNLKSRNLVEKLGVSIYDVEELEKVNKLIDVDIVQAPLNIVDRRLETSGWLSKLYKNNVEIHTRSTFLQGLLLMPRSKIPTKFNKWSKIWDRWNNELNKNNLDAITACLSYPLSLPEVDKIIVGVENINQLNEIVLASKQKIKNVNWSFMISNDQMLVNPSNWTSL
jgi:aryl-alcohol dehydrogenase-like predicted oxidoreductase